MQTCTVPCISALVFVIAVAFSSCARVYVRIVIGLPSHTLAISCSPSCMLPLAGALSWTPTPIVFISLPRVCVLASPRLLSCPQPWYSMFPVCIFLFPHKHCPHTRSRVRPCTTLALVPSLRVHSYVFPLVRALSQVCALTRALAFIL